MKRNAVDKLIAYFNPEAGLRRDKARAHSDFIQARNGYDAAGTGRRNRWFRGADTSVNAENGAALSLIRARSRELVRNNPYASKAIDVIVSNTVGSGIIPSAQSKSEKKQRLANELMAEWIQQCDFDGKLDLYGLQALIMRTQSESGEALLLWQSNPKMRIPFQVKLVEGDHLDHQKDVGSLADGGTIIQGVQFDTRNRVSGYWIFPEHPGDRKTLKSISSQFASRDRVCHVFELQRPGQIRGIPRGVSGFTKMRALDDFQDARLEQQKAAACLVGIIRDNENASNAGETLPSKLEPGMFPQIGYGKDVIFNSPPSTNGHGEYCTIEQRAIASAYGITYESLTGDLSAVNFSSAKMGWIEFSRNVDRWRWNMLIPMALKQIEKWFLESAYFAGFDLSGVTFEWTAPRREMIDPTKEIPAQIKAIRAGLKSWQETARENGFDPEQLTKEIKEDNKRFDDAGLVLDSDSRKTATSGQFQVENTPSTPQE